MPSKILGTPSSRSYHIPACSSCEGQMQHNDQGEWFCLPCGDAWLEEYVSSQGVSAGGVDLPRGVSDDRKKTPSFRDLIPNRAARRRAR